MKLMEFNFLIMSIQSDEIKETIFAWNYLKLHKLSLYWYFILLAQNDKILVHPSVTQLASSLLYFLFNFDIRNVFGFCKGLHSKSLKIVSSTFDTRSTISVLGRKSTFYILLETKSTFRIPLKRKSIFYIHPGMKSVKTRKWEKSLWDDLFEYWEKNKVWNAIRGQYLSVIEDEDWKSGGKDESEYTRTCYTEV